jgi:hypothetical protein
VIGGALLKWSFNFMQAHSPTRRLGGTAGYHDT